MPTPTASRRDVHRRRAVSRFEGRILREVCPVDCIYEAERLLVMRPAINYAQSRGTAAVDALVAPYARDDPGDPPPPE